MPEMRSVPKKHVHNIFLIAASLIVGTLLSVVVAEVYFRWQDKPAVLTPGCGWIADPMTGFVNPPSRECRLITTEYDYVYRLNSDGHIGKEFDPDPALYPILAVGDSHTFGLGVTDTEAWPHVVEQILRRPRVLPVQVINTGVSAFNLGQEYLHMKKFLDKYRVRHVVLAMSMSTDFYDIRTPAQGGFVAGNEYSRPYFDVDNGKLILRPAGDPRLTRVSTAPADQTEHSQPRGQRLRSFLFRHSALVRATRRGAIGLYGVRLLRWFGVNPWGNADTVLARDLSPVDAHSWLIVEKLLAEFQIFLQSRHIGFTIVIAPYLPQVYDDIWNRAFGSNSAYDRFAGNQRLRGICAQYNLDCLDTTDAFIDRVRSTRRWLHYPIDGHPNAEGHHLIGELVTRHLEQRLTVLVDKPARSPAGR